MGVDGLDEVRYSGEGGTGNEAIHAGASAVWNGGRSHRIELVRSVAGVKTIVQPPYSPELNPAERVFEEVRRWVEGRVYESLEE